MHSAICAWITSPQTSPVFTALLLEPFLEPQMYMNSVFLIFLLVSLELAWSCDNMWSCLVHIKFLPFEKRTKKYGRVIQPRNRIVGCYGTLSRFYTHTFLGAFYWRIGNILSINHHGSLHPFAYSKQSFGKSFPTPVGLARKREAAIVMGTIK